MSISQILRSFRDALSPSRSGEVTFEDEIQLYRRRAEVALREERYSDGLVFLAKILRLNPDDLGARTLVAEIYHHAIGDAAKALVTYEKVIATTGYDETDAYCRRAREGIRELTAATGAAPPVDPPFVLDDDETPQAESGGLPHSVAG